MAPPSARTGGAPPLGRVPVLLTALGVLVLAALASLALGSKGIGLPAVLQGLLHGSGDPDAVIVRQLRVPRTFIGIATGAALGLAGAVMQSVTRNPIADPGILGVSQGAASGVVIAVSVFSVTSYTAYVWWGFLGALCAAAVVYGLAGRGRDSATPVKLALAGSAIGAFIGALNNAVLTTNAATYDQFRFWQIGSLGTATERTAWQLLPFVAVGCALVLPLARSLDVLALGDEAAAALGTRVRLVRAVAVLGATVLTGASVAATGPVAFVGLLAPHAARALVGVRHLWLLPLSALCGAALLLSTDTVGRILFPPSEVPAGVMTAVAGVPLLIWLVRARKGVPV
ncbi:iron ABC transporter permease [Streptomyces sp. NPDC050095]|uniref:FecCD family ABC transporter permease n=1 Tax=unclassified Streptomyces TaxID=2593676 RepID=UPI00343C619B